MFIEVLAAKSVIFFSSFAFAVWLLLLLLVAATTTIVDFVKKIVSSNLKSDIFPDWLINHFHPGNKLYNISHHFNLLLVYEMFPRRKKVKGDIITFKSYIEISYIETPKLISPLKKITISPIKRDMRKHSLK